MLSNAIKFTPSGGNIEISVITNENELQIHVIDSGLGIPDNKIEKLFSKYQMVHSAGTAGEKGSGLGLFICKKLVEAHGGEISVTSGQGKGSDFYFTIPQD